MFLLSLRSTPILPRTAVILTTQTPLPLFPLLETQSPTLSLPSASMPTLWASTTLSLSPRSPPSPLLAVLLWTTTSALFPSTSRATYALLHLPQRSTISCPSSSFSSSPSSTTLPILLLPWLRKCLLWLRRCPISTPTSLSPRSSLRSNLSSRYSICITFSDGSSKWCAPPASRSSTSLLMLLSSDACADRYFLCVFHHF